MNNDKIDKQLREMFDKIPLENPSPEFMDKLMALVEKEAGKKKARQRWAPILQIAAGVTGIFFLPGLIIYVCTLLIPDFSFSFIFPQVDVKISLMAISIALAVFFLLAGDSLLQKYIFRKKIKKLISEAD